MSYVLLLIVHSSQRLVLLSVTVLLHLTSKNGLIN